MSCGLVSLLLSRLGFVHARRQEERKERKINVSSPCAVTRAHRKCFLTYFFLTVLQLHFSKCDM